MYLDYYNLNSKPFQISTDPRFLWLGEKHKEALAVLKYGILDNKGFLLLTGDVGTGKTTLLNALIDSLGDEVIVAFVTDPGLAKMDFFNFVADSLEIDKSFRSKGEFLIYLKKYLLDVYRQQKQVLLIIDECQNLSQKLLEEIRLLSNIEKQSVKLINIFFVGQIEFNEIILRPRNRAIRQRITINYNISALSESETEKYIQFRLEVAGAKESIFTSRAIKEVHKFSNGYPRLINIICDQALLTGFVHEKRKVDHKIVTECAAELKIPNGIQINTSNATPETAEVASGPKAPADEAGKPANRKLSRYLIMVCFLIVMLWLGLAAHFFFSRQHNATTGSIADRGDHPGKQDPQRFSANPHGGVRVAIANKQAARGSDTETAGIGDEDASGSETESEDLVATRAAPVDKPKAIPASTLSERSKPPATDATDRKQKKNSITLKQIEESFGLYPQFPSQDAGCSGGQ
jgi:general secretion pathway protein A